MSVYEELLRGIREADKISRGAFGSDFMDILKAIWEEYEKVVAEHWPEKRDLISRMIQKMQNNLKAGEYLVRDIGDGNPDSAERSIIPELEALPRVNVPSLRIGGRTLGPGDLCNILAFWVGPLGIDPFSNQITTGYTHEIGKMSHFVGWPASLSIYGLTNLLVPGDPFEERIMQLQRQYRCQMPKEVRARIEAIQSVREDLKFLLELVRTAINWLREQTGDQFVSLGDSFGFYQNASIVYREDEIFIFSLTPGLLIPREYEGDVGQNKNSFRNIYFRNGIEAKKVSNRTETEEEEDERKLKMHYQWNRSTAARALYEDFKFKRDKEKWTEKEFRHKSVTNLARFLSIPNLDITEAEFGEDDFRREFTLVTPHDTVFSVRDREAKKITHGLLVDKRGNINLYLRAGKEIEEKIPVKVPALDSVQIDQNMIFQSVRAFLDKERPIVVKPSGDLKDGIQPETLAREIFDVMFDEGQRLVNG